MTIAATVSQKVLFFQNWLCRSLSMSHLQSNPSATPRPVISIEKISIKIGIDREISEGGGKFSPVRGSFSSSRGAGRV
jgi:hypothetical protein